MRKQIKDNLKMKLDYFNMNKWTFMKQYRQEMYVQFRKMFIKQNLYKKMLISLKAQQIISNLS